MSKSSNTRTLVEGAMLIALATLLSYIKFYDMPYGGSITLEMLPLVIMGLRNGTKWGCFTGFVHGLLQMILGFSNVMYCATLLSQIGCIVLDYLLAFTVLGLAPLFAKLLPKNPKLGYVAGSIICGLLRFLCSFLSGWLLWGSYAPEGMSAVWYSFVYNASYMVPDIIILAVVVGILSTTVPKLFRPSYA
jgi:thiamine transporter